MLVPQHVLNWLYSVLTSEYHDANHTYHDVAQTLSQYTSLSPRTDVYTFPNGTSALLLHLSGTIPVSFRGTTYRFPVSIWVPYAYPREAPFVYVTPTENMVVRPGQHVDPQGLVYHPYLVGWSTFWDKSSILDLLAILGDIFSKEPPVIARQPERQAQNPETPTQPPVPPPSPDFAPRSSGAQAMVTPPGSSVQSPLPPPKPGLPIQLDHAAAYNAPPRPSLPHEMHRPTSQYGPESRYGPPQEPAKIGPSRYDAPPPLPDPSPAQRARPVALAVPSCPPTRLQNQARPPERLSPDPRRVSTLMKSLQQAHGPTPPGWPQSQPRPPPAQAAAASKAIPPPDLMDDDLRVFIPSPDNAPPPRIPPNPEKDMLLHQLAATLHEHRARARAQNAASMAGLQAQRAALFSAQSALQAEQSQLGQLSNLLTNNTAILQDSIQKANAIMETSAQHPAPEIDELLVSQTVVGNQLYEVVAEERALADAIFMLGRAVERGRVAPETFTKMTRALAREWFLKKALVKKIGKGMGLSMA